ncbi:metallophosphoesterase family protein [Croceimicrobium sp.]|uniref:metallophosphoesterase family protein n=1 Tax=Croceimicrobium sp. TaxID=2828340 RepID=UPI003BAC384A
MVQISLLSDSHSHIDPAILKQLKGSDEIWHAGDIGDLKTAQILQKIAPLRAVYGNIDAQELRQEFPLNNSFEIEGIKVLMTHIAGYPARYNGRVKKLLGELKPDLFICGHSHILKVMRDPQFGHMHMNPGAVGLQGFHQVRTLLQFKIEKGKISDLAVAEWPRWPKN